MIFKFKNVSLLSRLKYPDLATQPISEEKRTKKILMVLHMHVLSLSNKRRT